MQAVFKDSAPVTEPMEPVGVQEVLSPNGFENGFKVQFLSLLCA
jgi:hypothetical protein